MNKKIKTSVNTQIIVMAIFGLAIAGVIVGVIMHMNAKLMPMQQVITIKSSQTGYIDDEFNKPPVKLMLCKKPNKSPTPAPIPANKSVLAKAVSEQDIVNEVNTYILNCSNLELDENLSPDSLSIGIVDNDELSMIKGYTGEVLCGYADMLSSYCECSYARCYFNGETFCILYK